MTDERIILAIGRLERALSRIEARKPQPIAPATAPPPPAISDQAYLALNERHQRLRGRVQGAIERIDHLIDSEGGDEG